MAGHLDRVPARPLQVWLERQVALLELREDLETTPREHLRRRLGVDEAMLRRWLKARGRSGNKVATHWRPTVEDALHRAGVFMFEVFPDLLDSVEVREGWCPGCDERVLADEEGRCLWCDMAVELEAVLA